MENAKHHPNTGKVTKTKTSSLLLSLRGVDSQKIHKGLDWITEPTKVGFEGWDLVKTLQCQKSTTVSEIARQVEISILPIWELAHQQLVFNVCFLVTYRRSHGGIVSCSLPASISLPPCLPPFQLVGLDRRSLLQRHPWRRCRQCKSDSTAAMVFRWTEYYSMRFYDWIVLHLIPKTMFFERKHIWDSMIHVYESTLSTPKK